MGIYVGVVVVGMILVPVSNQSILYFKVSLRKNFNFQFIWSLCCKSGQQYPNTICFFFFNQLFISTTNWIHNLAFFFNFAVQSATKYRKVLNGVYSIIYWVGQKVHSGFSVTPYEHFGQPNILISTYNELSVTY